jgi:3-hydroxyacyl-[acyl-carrier-protein] dehydratase
MAGERRMDPADPVFGGHFPDFPVYPGNFTVESIGQLGLCLYYFVANGLSAIAPEARPLALRATKIAGSLFIEPIRPGDTVTMLVRKHSWDGYFASLVGQALVNGKVAVVTMGEVMILED